MWLTERERVTLTVVGLVALVGLGVLVWWQHRPPITVASGPPPPYAEWDAALQDATQVDINQATAAELERLPDIGPSLAGRIVAYRQAHGGFQRIDELLGVPGIGPKTLEALREYVTVK